MQELPFYDEDGRVIRKEIAHWNATSNTWENQTKTEYQRDENGILLLREKFQWMLETSDWKANEKASFSVNDQNNRAV
ncbi:MAG: DUF3836 domain-containing protein [Crocinitomicaceae bacterium]|nr:DUF3836 domain-containing protein [Crocinitomicaceae bacterium]